MTFYHGQSQQRGNPLAGEDAVYPPIEAEDYLVKIISPIYDFIAHEVSKRANEPIAERVMYDDITECFWQRPMLDQLLPPGKPTDLDKAVHAYPHLRKLLTDPQKYAPVSEEDERERRRLEKRGRSGRGSQGRPSMHPLRAFFGKTYLEKPGWIHCYHVFGRILLWHALAFHAALIGTFYGWQWEHLNTVCITHACGKILRQLIDISIGHPPRSAESRVFGFRSGAQSHTEHVTLILLFLLVPATYVFETYVRRGGLTTIYDAAAIGYVFTFGGSFFIHSKPGYRLRSLWRKRHEPHIGSEEQLRVPLGTFVTYNFFWGLVLALKLSFDIFFIVKPLKQPVLGLLHYPFPRLMWAGCSTASGHALCSAYEVGLRWGLVLLRVSVPFLVFYFDTYIFFNGTSARLWPVARTQLATHLRAIITTHRSMLGHFFVSHCHTSAHWRRLTMEACHRLSTGQCARLQQQAAWHSLQWRLSARSGRRYPFEQARVVHRGAIARVAGTMRTGEWCEHA